MRRSKQSFTPISTIFNQCCIEGSWFVWDSYDKCQRRAALSAACPPPTQASATTHFVTPTAQRPAHNTQQAAATFSAAAVSCSATGCGGASRLGSTAVGQCWPAGGVDGVSILRPTCYQLSTGKHFQGICFVNCRYVFFVNFIFNWWSISITEFHLSRTPAQTLSLGPVTSQITDIPAGPTCLQTLSAILKNTGRYNLPIYFITGVLLPSSSWWCAQLRRCGSRSAAICRLQQLLLLGAAATKWTAAFGCPAATAGQRSAARL